MQANLTVGDRRDWLINYGLLQSVRTVILLIIGLGCLTQTQISVADTDNTGAHSEQTAPDAHQFIVSGLIINRRDIFGSGTAVTDVTRRIYRVIDALHITTREKTILREIDLAPGRRLFAADVSELERDLRAMGLFASVAVKLVPIDDTHAELHINTRDRLSVVFGASGSFLGGIGELGFTIGERNVNGSGDRLLLSYSGTTDGELRGAIAYDDIHFLDNRHSAAYSIGKTEEGRFYHFKFSRPFKTRVNNLSWSVKAESIGSDIDYYDGGVSVAQVPQQSESLILEAYRRVTDGSSMESSFSRYFRYGSVLRYDRDSYEPTRGLQPDLIDPPLDNTRVFAGALLALNRNTRFEKTRGVDSIRFTEDLAFGYSAELLAGVDLVDNSQESSETSPAIFLEARYAFGSTFVGESSRPQNHRSILPTQTFGKVSLDAYSNLQSNDKRSWSAGLTLKLFNRSLESHTFASRFSFITSDRGNSLPTQYTLGESNGLRGYAARQFSGSSRFRVNLEDRINTGWRVGAFDIGLLAFVDAGWAGDDSSQRSLKTAAGVGLRLGSTTLLGADIARLDLAYPFNPVDGDNRLSVSISLGQVFSF